MGRYLGRRLAVAAGTLLLVTVLVFIALHAIPGGYADILLGPTSTPEARAHVTAAYGLDQPVALQYLQWLRHAVTGDLGQSLGTGEPVAEQLIRRFPVTAELTLLALAITLLIGLPLALIAGMARTRVGTGATRLGGAIAMSVPDFVLGSLILYLFSTYALGLRPGGYTPLAEDPVDNLRGMLLPALTLSTFGIAVLVRTGRDAVATVMSSPHITAAVSRGASNFEIVRHHVLRNSAIPIVTVLAVYVGYLMGGAVIVENLYSLPGLGQLVLDGVSGRDYAVVQGVVLVSAGLFILVNLLADVAYGVIDPRVQEMGRR